MQANQSDKDSDRPPNWQTAKIVQRLIAYYYKLHVKVDSSGEVISRKHWIDIHNSLRALYGIYISVKSLKAHQKQIKDWVDNGHAEDLDLDDARAVVEDTFPSLKENESTPTITTKPQPHSTTIRPSTASSSSSTTTLSHSSTSTLHRPPTQDQISVLISHIWSISQDLNKLTKAHESIARVFSKSSNIEKFKSCIRLLSQNNLDEGEDEDDEEIKASESDGKDGFENVGEETEPELITPPSNKRSNRRTLSPTKATSSSSSTTPKALRSNKKSHI